MFLFPSPNPPGTATNKCLGPGCSSFFVGFRGQPVWIPVEASSHGQGAGDPRGFARQSCRGLWERALGTGRQIDMVVNFTSRAPSAKSHDKVLRWDHYLGMCLGRDGSTEEFHCFEEYHHKWLPGIHPLNDVQRVPNSNSCPICFPNENK